LSERPTSHNAHADSQMTADTNPKPPGSLRGDRLSLYLEREAERLRLRLLLRLLPERRERLRLRLRLRLLRPRERLRERDRLRLRLRLALSSFTRMYPLSKGLRNSESSSLRSAYRMSSLVA
jgi:hypothetical protein